MHGIALAISLAFLLCACASQQGPLRYEWGELRDAQQQGQPAAVAASNPVGRPLVSPATERYGTRPIAINAPATRARAAAGLYFGHVQSSVQAYPAAPAADRRFPKPPRSAGRRTV